MTAPARKRAKARQPERPCATWSAGRPRSPFPAGERPCSTAVRTRAASTNWRATCATWSARSPSAWPFSAWPARKRRPWTSCASAPRRKGCAAPELACRQQEFARLAPHGLDPLREQALRLQAVLEASGLDPEALDVDAEVAELDKRSERLKQEAAANLKDLDDAEKRIAEQESEIEGGLGRFSSPKNGSLPGNSPPSNGKVVAAGLRQEEAAAKEKQARLRATVEVFRGDLERMLTPAQLDDEIRRRSERARGRTCRTCPDAAE